MDFDLALDLDLTELVFFAASCVAVLASLAVVVSKNSVRAVLSLVLAFVATSVTWLVIEAEFLAISLVLVYVGAVMVLFLFVVMMLDIELEPLKQAFIRHLPLGITVALMLLAFLMLAVVFPQSMVVPEVGLHPHGEAYSNLKEIGQTLFTDYLLAFEAAGVLLLVAMVAAIGLTFRGRQNAKSQSVSAQVQVTKQSRLRVVDVPRIKGNT